jgi:hypothetical protein
MQINSNTNLIQLSAKQRLLHERALHLSQQHANLEFARVENLIQIEASRVHLAFGKKMFIYATEILGMDAAVAYSYISIARACVKFHELKKALSEGSLTISKAARLVSALGKENAKELINFAKTHSKRDIEDEIAKRNPKAGTRDRVRPLNADFDELKVRLPKSVSKDLRRVQALNPSLDLAATIQAMIEFYLERKDPVRKAERAKSLEERKQQRQRQKFSPGRKRTPLTAAQQHTVHRRDRGQCAFLGPDGKRCGDDRWTEIHHVIPVHLGGTNDPDNLTTLCSFHHDLVHQLTLPLEGQVTWLR